MNDTSAYEQALFGRVRIANDDARPPRPNAIQKAIAVFGRDHIAIEGNGKFRILLMGRWTSPMAAEELIRQANIRLKAEGKPQILNDPRWRV